MAGAGRSHPILVHMYAAQAEALRPHSYSFVERVNGPYHELALRTFMVIVLAHWAEHLFQAFQIYVLGWPVPEEPEQPQIVVREVDVAA